MSLRFKHPAPKEEGSGVDVKKVPVGVGVAAKRIACVAAAVGNVNGVEAVTVGSDVTVGGAVLVAGGAIAVWV
jgi:hypothetical protein